MKRELVVSKNNKDIISESKNLISTLNEILPKNKNLPTNEQKNITIHISVTNGYKFFSCSKYIAINHGSIIKLFDISINKVIHTFSVDSKISVSYAIAFSPDEKYLVAINNYCKLYIWSILELRLITSFLNNNIVYCKQDITFSNNMEYLIIGSQCSCDTFDNSGVGIINFKNIIEDDKKNNLKKNAKTNNLINVNIETKKYILDVFKTKIEYADFVVVTKNNKYLITGHDDYTIRVWDIKKRKEIHTLNKNNKYIYSNKFSEIQIRGLFETSNNIVVAGHSDGTIDFWDILKKQKIKSLKIDCYELKSITLSPDKKYIIALISSENALLAIYRSENGEEVGIYNYKNLGMNWHSHEPTITNSGYIVVRNSDDTKKILTLNKDGKSVKLLSKLNHETTNIYNKIAITSNNKYIIMLNKKESTNNLELIDIETGEIVSSYKFLTKRIISSVFVYNGIDCIVIRDNRDFVAVWDIFNAKKIQTFNVIDTKDTYKAYITNNGQYIALTTAYGDKNYILEIKTAKIIQEFNANVISLKFVNNDQDIIYVNYPIEIYIWNIKKRAIVKTITIEEGQDVTYFSNKYYVTSSFENGTVWLYNIESQKVLKTFKCHSEHLKFAYITKNEKKLITMSWDKTTRFWDIESGNELVSKRLNYTYDSDSIIITSDEKYMIGNRGYSIEIFDIKANEMIANHINYTDESWVYYNKNGYYNSNNNTIDRISFIEKNKKSFKILKDTHPIYKLRKIKKVLEY